MKLDDRPPLVVGAERLPWGDAAFSERMLAEHLDTSHDLASRRPAHIDAFVDRLHGVLAAASTIADLGCGPGLHAERLRRRGHPCIGVDIAPASVRDASARGVPVVRADLRHLPLHAVDVALVLYGELNTFPRGDRVLQEVVNALRPGGVAVIELSTEAGVRRKAKGVRSWPAVGGLFADGAHTVFHESRWDEGAAATVERWCAVDDAGEVITSIGTTTWCIDHRELGGAGLNIIDRWGDPDDDFLVVLGRT